MWSSPPSSPWFPGVTSSWVWWVTRLEEYHQAGRLTQAFDAWSFYWGLITYCLPDWPSFSRSSWRFKLTLSVSSFSESWNGYGISQKPHHKSHWWTSQGSKSLDKNTPVRTLQRPRNQVPVTEGNGQTSFWENLILHCTGNDSIWVWEFSFWGDKNVLKLILVMVAQLCEYTQNHGILHIWMSVYVIWVISQQSC